MRARAFSFLFSSIVLSMAAMASAQAQAVASGEPAPLRVEIVGASVSAGFADGTLLGGKPNRTVALQKVMRGWLDGVAAVQNRADASLFMAAEQRGEAAVTRVAKGKPELVVAVDFLFWFGYGYVDVAGPGEVDARLARLRHGLGLLDRIECPIVVGDLPDVHGAAVRMISPEQIPADEALERLNREVADWAKSRPRVRMFPLRALVAEMKGKGITLPLAGGAVATPPGALMQTDRLHATRVGMALLGYQLQEHCKSALPKPAAERLPKWTFEQFVEAAEASSDLEDLLSTKSSSR